MWKWRPWSCGSCFVVNSLHIYKWWANVYKQELFVSVTKALLAYARAHTHTHTHTHTPCFSLSYTQLRGARSWKRCWESGIRVPFLPSSNFLSLTPIHLDNTLENWAEGAAQSWGRKSHGKHRERKISGRKGWMDREVELGQYLLGAVALPHPAFESPGVGGSLGCSHLGSVNIELGEAKWVQSWIWELFISPLQREKPLLSAFLAFFSRCPQLSLLYFVLPHFLCRKTTFQTQNTRYWCSRSNRFLPRARIPNLEPATLWNNVSVSEWAACIL